MRLYLDNSVLNRPYDDMNQPRIWFETLSLYFVLSLVEFGEAQLIRSTMHQVENARNPNPPSRRWVQHCLTLASAPSIVSDDTVVQRAGELHIDRFKFQDALHLALAEKGRADYFLTCDDALIRQYSGPMKVLSPTDFIKLF